MDSIRRSYQVKYVPVLIVILASLLFLFNLGQGAFRDYDEALYAEVIHDTEVSGDPFTLQYFGAPWINNKPPLYFWSAMVAEKVIPTKELAYRLPSAISGILCIILVMLIAYELSQSYAVASMAGAILMASPMFLYAARQLRLDVPVTSAILFSGYSFIRGLRDERWYAGIGIGIAIGLMTKNVIGLFPIGFIVIWCVIHRGVPFLKSMYFWLGIAAMLLIALPWHIYETAIFGPSFLDLYFLNHTANGLGTDLLGNSGHLSNWVKYFSILLTWAQPWPLISVLCLPILWRMYTKGESIKNTLIFLLFPIGILSFFLIASTKQSYYLTPIYPFIAIFIALMAHWLFKKSAARGLSRIGIVGIGALLFIGAFANTIYVGYNYADYEQLIANEERDLGSFLNANQNPPLVYTYYWDYWDTIRYYGGGRALQQMRDGQPINNSFFLVVHSGYTFHFPPWFTARLTTVYKGLAMTVYKFTYSPPAK